MIMRKTFRSALAKDILRYIHLKQALGRQFEHASSVLFSLDRFLSDLGKPPADLPPVCAPPVATVPLACVPPVAAPPAAVSLPPVDAGTPVAPPVLLEAPPVVTLTTVDPPTAEEPPTPGAPPLVAFTGLSWPPQLETVSGMRKTSDKSRFRRSNILDPCVR